MSATKAITKAITIGLTIVSFVAVAETYYDRKFYTAKFMDNVEEVQINIAPALEKRVVASKEKDLPLVHRIQMQDKSLVNGSWMITRVSQFFDDNERVVFDKLNKNEDKNTEVVVDFKMIEMSTVRINNDVEQTYKISLLTENGTIALFKEFGDGYEVVEARRVIKKEENVETAEEKVQEEKKNKFDIRDDLYLVSAVDPKREKNVARGAKVEGYAYLKNGELIVEGIQLHIGSQHQTESLSTEMRVKAHGTFNDQNGNQGIITMSSKQEIKVRFSTGPLAGALLNFATYDKKQELERKYNESQRQVEAAMNDDSEERREVGGDIQGLEAIPQNAGFMSEETSRDIANDGVQQYPEVNNGDEYEQDHYGQDYNNEDYQEDNYDEQVSSVLTKSEDRAPASVKKSAGFKF